MSGHTLCPVCRRRVKAGKDGRPKRHRRDGVKDGTVWVEPCEGGPEREAQP